MTSSAADDPMVVKVSTPADILGVLPHRLGFHPQESLVVVCLEGPRRRDHLVMRVDLVASRHDAAVVADLAERVRHAGATAAVVVVYTETPFDGELARADLVRALLDRLRRRRIDVIEALLVQGRRWFSYQCEDETCCPAVGTPLPDRLTPAAGRYAAEAVAQGAVVLADRESVQRSVEPSDHPVAAAVREQAADAAGELLMDAAVDGGLGGACALTLATLRRLVATWSDGARDIDPVDAAVVAVGMHDKRARDEAMTLVLDHEPGVLVSLLTELARSTGDQEAAPVCTVLAWAAYADGGGALAAVAAERALRAQPGYSMAELVLEGLHQMLSPRAVRRICEDVRAELAGEP